MHSYLSGVIFIVSKNRNNDKKHTKSIGFQIKILNFASSWKDGGFSIYTVNYLKGSARNHFRVSGIPFLISLKACRSFTS